MGLNAALALAGRSLEVFSAGLQVAGQNIANANTPGYVREKLILTSGSSYRDGNLVYGTGVQAGGIRQQLDKYLETRLNTASSDVSGATTRDAVYKQLEATLQELGDSDLSTGLNDFLGKIHDIANQPETASARQLAVTQGTQFATSIQDLRGRIDQLRSAQSVQVTDLVSEANRLIDQVAKLNPQIVSLESAGLGASDASDLRSQRYTALTRLSEILPVKTIELSNGSVNVSLGSDNLIQDGKVQHLTTTTSLDRGVVVITPKLAESNAPLQGSGGELNGVIAGRDQILGGFVDQLDTYAANLIYEFNKLHASGEGAAGFESVTGTNAVADVNASLNAAGLAFTPQHGSFQVKVVNQTTGIATTTTVPVDLDGIGGDTTLESLRTALNGIGNISATVGIDRKLTLTAADGYEIKFGNDTSGTLASLGINTFFTGSSSADIGVNQTVVGNPDLFAAGRGGGPADGSNALALTQFTSQSVASLGNVNLDDFYQSIVSQLAQESAGQTALVRGFTGYRDSLQSQRAQFSGVSVDEEALNMLQFQRSYQAAAKMISTVDELLNVLLNI